MTKHEQIVADIIRRIRSGELGPDEPLGTNQELLERYQAGYGTLQHARRTLQEKGLVYSKVGNRGGTYVEPMAPYLA
jgi:DNA-binding GntR family transcriptional regulator